VTGESRIRDLTREDLGVHWERYVQLTQIEAAFKTMKIELGCARSTSGSAMRSALSSA
jgi:hypothetical protein